MFSVLIEDDLPAYRDMTSISITDINFRIPQNLIPKIKLHIPTKG